MVKTFDVKVLLAGREMTCTMNASSAGKLLEDAIERFGIRFNEIHKIEITSSSIQIAITPPEHTAGDPT